MIKKSTIPPHLNQRSWLEFEEETATELCRSLARELKLLDKKDNATHVHDTRVVLRRWDSVWSVLERDGWATKKYAKDVGKKLKKLRKLLGMLRDWDVNIETGATLGVPKSILKQWTDQRAMLAKKVHKDLADMDLPKLIKKLRKFIPRRPLELRQEIARTRLRTLAQTAFAHLEPYLVEQENGARALEKAAHDWQSLHALRLGIKAWRYLLTEFFGLTNLQLVRGQQLLGKYNDINRIARLLRQDSKSQALAKDALSKIESQSEQLMKEFSEFRETLPYGLRPAFVSIERR